jgi:hypothetical protein
MTMSIEWTELEVHGASGPIRNTFLRQGGSCLAVALPGFRGGWLVPAVYYPVLCLVDRGADVLCLDSIYQTDPNPERLYQDSLAAIAAGTSAASYREVVVIGKSLGTSAMAELSVRGRLPVGAPTIWLTPLLKADPVVEAIRRLKRPGLIVIGTADPNYVRDRLDSLEQARHSVLVLEGVNHGLAVDGSAERSAEVPHQLVRAVKEYLAATRGGEP